jgi:hypothetical protein
MIWRIGFKNDGRASGAYKKYVSTRVPDIFKQQFFKVKEYIGL